MTSFFDKLNLRPNERRLVIGVAIVVFIIINAIFIWPRFGDWNKLKNRRVTAERTREQYQQEVDKMPTYQKLFGELERAGQTVNSEDQAIKLSSTLYNQAALSGVAINNYYEQKQSSAAKPNQFFDEKSGTLLVAAEEKSLVDFLYNLGMGGSLIRVRSMTISPDVPARQKLGGNLQMVASYARKAPPKVAPAAAPARTNAPAMRPVSPTGTKPTFPSARTSNAPPALKTNPPPKK